jgi:hypothetical protein
VWRRLCGFEPVGGTDPTVPTSACGTSRLCPQRPVEFRSTLATATIGLVCVPAQARPASPMPRHASASTGLGEEGGWRNVELDGLDRTLTMCLVS